MPPWWVRLPAIPVGTWLTVSVWLGHGAVLGAVAALLFGCTFVPLAFWPAREVAWSGAHPRLSLLAGGAFMWLVFVAAFPRVSLVGLAISAGTTTLLALNAQRRGWG